MRWDARSSKPTVLADVTSDSLVAQEGTFGPLAPVIRFEDEADCDPDVQRLALRAYLLLLLLGSRPSLARGGSARSPAWSA